MRAFLLFMATAGFASAQSPETLDWHRYYPLAVGNVWEYHDAENTGPHVRMTLVSDTTANDITYFRQRLDWAMATNGPAGADTSRWTTDAYVRYTDTGVVSRSSIDADTSALARCSVDPFERDLSLAFTSRVACSGVAGELAGADSVFVDGAYDAPWQPFGLRGAAPSFEAAAVKTYSVGILFTTFVADVGPIAEGNLWGRRLHYAKIGGQEYGAPGFVVSTPRGAPRPGGPEMRVLGNPTTGNAAFAFRTKGGAEAAASVFDMLGRRVWESSVATGADWLRITIPTAAWPAGAYVIVVEQDGERATRPFTLANR